jgi:cephalosporin hydroxylase
MKAMDPRKEFDEQKRTAIAVQGRDQAFRELARDWYRRSWPHRYSYAFTWLGLPIIQYPQDIVALQELVWRVRPEVIVETGIAWGGSLLLSASLLELIGGTGRVVGVDIDIRPHNRAAIEAHPLMKRITLIEGSSIDAAVAAKVSGIVRERPKGHVVVILDSSHTHRHVTEELRLYSPLVTAGSYLVVLDTVIDDLPAEMFPDRPWGPGDNPRTAVREFLRHSDRFVVESEIEDKLLITAAPGGYLRCVKE